MSTYNDLLSNTRVAIQALGFTWGTSNTAVPVLVASQPIARETLEQPLPIIVVSLSSPEGLEQGCTGGYMDAVYRAQISVVAGGNAEFETNLSTYLTWRESLRKAFQRIVYNNSPYVSITSMYMVEVKPLEVLTRDLQADNYDFSLLEINYHVLEAAS